MSSATYVLKENIHIEMFLFLTNFLRSTKILSIVLMSEETSPASKNVLLL